ncbi:ABC transporter ATP-binding protein [Aestuariivirga sp. YIM B02566]|uniref:ABC transporter ATP-binding protein n=1 Tax=Taklimakanibacter albus TaxID=2800327 RepID=A0ACC5R6N5_9HYPH|nr:ABC transporter ATP-binding protein [Aestuariivirga sp. YIM B02566]MBK1868233.1 ABC transporter ATP-binding protein [Aestuariivirga sp. YIM B02566]
MSLELKNVTKRVGADTHIHETSLRFEDGSFNILLGTTLSGKTSLMQLMAGLDRPSSGEVWFAGKNVTGVPVQKRNVSMVYQQFINYPNFSVYENIASPLRVAGMAEAQIDKRVQQAADLLRLGPMLKRRPSELSGGQQQRTAIARALVKDFDMILLDEPLANLDYKLREELRDELPKLFAGRNCIVVYATTEPTEALLFGGNTVLLHEGRVTQFGPTSSIYRKPADLTSAQVFSDPPINTAKVMKKGDQITLENKVTWRAPKAARVPDGAYTIAIRPHHITPVQQGREASTIEGRVLVTELSGSESVVHFDMNGQTWVSQSHGIHPFEVGATAKLFVDVDQGFFFDGENRLIGAAA